MSPHEEHPDELTPEQIEEMKRQAPPAPNLPAGISITEVEPGSPDSPQRTPLQGAVDEGTQRVIDLLVEISDLLRELPQAIWDESDSR